MYKSLLFLLVGSEGNVTQPESKSLVAWMKETPFVLSASLHGGSLVVSFPYTSSPSEIPEPVPTEDDDIFKNVALSYSTLHPTMSRGQPFCPGAHVQDRFQDGIVNMAEWKDHSMKLLDYQYSQGRSFHFAIFTGCCKSPNPKELPILWREHKNSLLKFITKVSSSICVYVCVHACACGCTCLCALLCVFVYLCVRARARVCLWVVWCVCVVWCLCPCLVCVCFSNYIIAFINKQKLNQ